jgi:hypothetical protein
MVKKEPLQEQPICTYSETLTWLWRSDRSMQPRVDVGISSNAIH